ncbi:MAG: hypothetical protein HQ582_15875 [Planctomycetes bacterium]|nr:hypothetical protein [Planctomycetota bacterium]
MNREQRTQEHFRDWQRSQTPAESELQDMAFDFQEKYFADLRLVAPSIRRQLFGQLYRAEGDPPDISIDEWIFRFRRFRKSRGIIGWYNGNHQTISIKPDLPSIEHRAALLHEMIHAYEFQLSLPESRPYRDWLLLDLHQRMLKRMKPAELRNRMRVSTQRYAILKDTTCGGHGLLFLLKSLDLDRRCRWKLGTVFGYGREDYFK